MMPSLPYADVHLAELLKVPLVECGLHFNLTYQSRFSSPLELLSKWVFCSSKTREEISTWILAEFRKQVAAMNSLGVKIEYFDGHEHCHMIPGLLDRLAPELRKASIEYIRVPLDWKLLGTKRFPIVGFSLRLQSRVRALGFKTHPFYYPKVSEFESSSRLRRALNRFQDYEILVHPAAENDFDRLGISDLYRDERVREFKALDALV